MRAQIRRLWNVCRSRDALVAVAAGAALVSALWGAYLGLDGMDEARDYYAALTPAQREDEIELALGFDSDLWNAIRRSVRDDDRFLVVSDAFEQHEVRNYAGYSLLPAIQVSDVRDADVVLYYATEPPQGARCARIGANVCLERRGGS